MKDKMSYNNFKKILLRLAIMVEKDKQQRAADIATNSRQEAEILREHAKKAIREYNQGNEKPILHVLPWIWSKDTSGSTSSTQMGHKNGFELRFSYYKSKQTYNETKNLQKIKIRNQHKVPPATTNRIMVTNFPSSTEKFSNLYNRLTDEAVQRAGFPAEKPQEEDRIPEIVKRKVATLWEMNICYADDAKAACFRMADSKRGGPYNWFTYSASSQAIYTNREYLVQIAAFHDLIFEYGYSPNWMKFEYHESVPPVWVSVDIGTKLPDGRKVFVEVKETKSQWESLISEVKSLGDKGIDLSAYDRGNDPLRKAKYIVAGRPDFFAGYFPEGFDTYKVTQNAEGRFSLEPTVLPKLRTFGGSFSSDPQSAKPTGSGTEFIGNLIDFLHRGFQYPVEIFKYLQSRNKCSMCKSSHNCERLIPHFSSQRPWSSGNLNKFYEWCRNWHWPKSTPHEYWINAVFSYPRVAEFLSREMNAEYLAIESMFKMEFEGKFKKGDSPPPCLWKKAKEDRVCIPKIFSLTGREMCCDFYLKYPSPNIVAEVKVAVPENVKNVEQFFKKFDDDIQKCKEWIKPDATKLVEDRLKVDGGFEYALAILIDLTEGREIRNLWEVRIHEDNLLKEKIFARLISPNF